MIPANIRQGAILAALIAAASGCATRQPHLSGLAALAPPQAPAAAAGGPAANDPEGLVALAVRERATDPVAAIRTLRKAIRQRPANRQAWHELTDIYKQAGYTDRALECVDEHLRSDPDDTDGLLDGAQLYAQLLEVGHARALLSRAAAARPQDPRVTAARAQLEYDFRHFDTAVATLKPLAHRSPPDPVLLARLSEYERTAGQWPQAEADIRAAIAASPQDGRWQRQLAHLLVTAPGQSRALEAEQAARRALALGDSSLDARYWLAVSLDRQGRTQDAIAAYEAVVRTDASYERAAYRLSRLYRKVGRGQEAQKLLDLYTTMDRNENQLNDVMTSLRTHPDRIDSYVRLAEIYRRAGAYGLAAARLRLAARRFGPQSALTHALYEVYVAAGRRVEAAQILRSQTGSRHA